MALARHLARATVPAFLCHSSYDAEAYAATLPRLHANDKAVDVFVERLFAQQPALYALLSVLASVSETAAVCHRVSSALLCHLIGQCFAQRGRRGSVALSDGARRLLQFLVRSQCLAGLLARVEDYLAFASAVEAADMLLSCWRFCVRFPPHLAQYDPNGRRVLPDAAVEALPTLSLPFRLCVANHVADGAAVQHLVTQQRRQ